MLGHLLLCMVFDVSRAFWSLWRIISPWVDFWCWTCYQFRTKWWDAPFSFAEDVDIKIEDKRTNQALYSQRLIDCMATYNYDLNWGDAIRKWINELVSLENTMISHDEAELMETINTEEEDRIQPHNWETLNMLIKISILPARLYPSNKCRTLSRFCILVYILFKRSKYC